VLAVQTTSLTRLLQDRSLRDALDAMVVFPKRGTKAILLTPATQNAGIDFGAVGTAYDYCLRCAITRLNKSNHDVIKSFQAFKYYALRYYGVPRVREQMEFHLNILDKYLDSDLVTTDDLFTACLFLAQFDSEYKSGRPIETFEVKKINVTELERIVSGSNLKWLIGKSVVIGPIFDCIGTESGINADGDLIVGKTLLDIKTSSRLALKEDFRQLIGYYILNRITGKRFDIENIAVYYPRFDYFKEIRINELMSESQAVALESVFIGRLGSDIQYDSSREREYGLSEKPIEAILTDDVGWTLLHHAAFECDRQRVSELIKIGADINAKDLQGRTPLSYALTKKNLGFMEFLIRSGANVNISDNNNVTALIWAVPNHNLALVELLLNAGAEVNCQDSDGWTPLHYAVMGKKKKIIQVLVERGADINAKEKEGDTPLSIALDYPKDHLVDLLRRRQD